SGTDRNIRVAEDLYRLRTVRSTGGAVNAAGIPRPPRAAMPSSRVRPTSSALHSLTWLLWAVAVAASIQIAPNPLYVALAIAIVALVTETHRQETRIARALPVLLA